MVAQGGLDFDDLGVVDFAVLDFAKTAVISRSAFVHLWVVERG
jgi:hypothetical protein